MPHLLKNLAFVFLLFLLIPAESFSAQMTLQGKVMHVKDGDTVDISPEEGGDFFTCRLYGIDTPETAKGSKLGQPYGAEAAKELKRLILGQSVEVTTTGQKTYKREVCLIKRNGIDINLEIVKKGYAWAYRQYLKRPYESKYMDAESEARARRLGLWMDANPTPPWEFRKLQRKN